MSKVEFSRLPLDVIPINYTITLKPNLIESTFNGELLIDIEVSKIDQ